MCGRFNIFDFVAILPFYLNLMFGVDSVLLRLVRIHEEVHRALN